MSSFSEQTDDVQFSEPILAKKDCKIKINFVEPAEWTVKEAVPGHAGEKYKALKVQVQIIDEDISTEHADAQPKRVFDDQFNIEKYPYLDKKTNTVRWLGRQKLYQLEAALGFDPVFVDSEGNQVEPHITKNGNKVAPKISGVKQKANPDFVQAYFDAEGLPIVDNWIDKEITADIELQRSEQYGNRNGISRYKKPKAE